MSEQTEALRLASLIQGRPDNAIIHGDKAAAELIRLEQSSREGWRYSDELEQERKRLEAENTDMERLMLSTVPDRWKSCTSPVGAVQSYIAELETANEELLEALEKISAIELQMYGPDWEEINIDRSVIEQALEWVEAQPEPRMLGAAKIINSLREALAAPQPQPVQEPVATVQCIHGVTIGYLEVMQPVGTKLYTSPQAQPLTVAGGAVFQDVEGKRPVTAIGQPVGRWEPTPLYPPGGAGLFFEKPQAQPLSDDASPISVLLAVEESIKNGECPWQIEQAFDEYEAQRQSEITKGEI